MCNILLGLSASKSFIFVVRSCMLLLPLSSPVGLMDSTLHIYINKCGQHARYVFIGMYIRNTSYCMHCNFYGVDISWMYQFCRFHVFNFTDAGEMVLKYSRMFRFVTFSAISILHWCAWRSLPSDALRLSRLSQGIISLVPEKPAPCVVQPCCARCSLASSSSCSHLPLQKEGFTQILHTAAFGDQEYACFAASKNKVLYDKGTLGR